MVQMVKYFRDIILPFYPKHIKAEIETALPELELQAARLGMEILHAEHNGTTYADAVRQPGDWPLMARVHFGLIDFLQHGLPPDFLEVLRALFLSIQEWTGLEDFRRLVFCRASYDDYRVDSALARFFVYQAIRLNAWILFWEKPEVEACGGFRQLDAYAEQMLRNRLGQPEIFDEEVRPLHVLVSDAVLWLGEQCRANRDAISSTDLQLHEFMTNTLVQIIDTARHLNSADATILRNDYADSIGETPLDSLLLAERHPHLFPSREAVYMRRSRLQRSLPDTGKVCNRLIDIFGISSDERSGQ